MVIFDGLVAKHEHVGFLNLANNPTHALCVLSRHQADFSDFSRGEGSGFDTAKRTSQNEHYFVFFGRI